MEEEEEEEEDGGLFFICSVEEPDGNRSLNRSMYLFESFILKV